MNYELDKNISVWIWELDGVKGVWVAERVKE